VIILTYVLLFIFLRSKLLFTPDFGESDAYHLNISLKYYLSTGLKQNTLPFWADGLEGGYPLFSEAQIGALFLPNMIFLRFFNFADGYNLLLISSLFFLTIGFYLLLRELEISAIIACIYAFIFTFNGSIALRWVHLNLLQSLSLVPLLFYTTIKMNKTNLFRYYVLFILIFSQVIFAGHMQVVFIGIFGIFLWNLGYVYVSVKNNIHKIVYLLKLIGVIVGGFIVSLPQILPNYLLSQYSNRSVSLDYTNATSFPFSWSHLIAFIKPFAFGNPKLGTYPPFSSNWGIFWENTPYLGILFFIVFVILLLLNRKLLSLSIKITLFLSFFFTFLALGKNSPFYFVFNFPPFNFFRTPSKYLLMTNFFLIVTVALLAEQWFKKTKFKILKIFFIFISFFIVFDLVRFTAAYHLFLPWEKVIRSPDSTAYVDSSTRYVTFGQQQKWNEIFLRKGWSGIDNVKDYLFMRNFLYPDSNLIFGKRVYNLNTGTFHLRRPEYVKNLIQPLEKDGQIEFESSSMDLMKALGIETVITGIPVKNKEMNLIKKLTRNSLEIYVYRVRDVKNTFYYVPKTVKKIEYLNEFEDFYKNNLLTENSVAEGINFSGIDNRGNYSIKPIRQSEYEYSFTGTFSDKTFLIFKKNMYPEWSITIDGKKTHMYQANLVHIGIIVPRGSHKIVLKYKNTYFKIGMFVSSLFIFGLFSFGLIRLKRS